MINKKSATTIKDLIAATDTKTRQDIVVILRGALIK